MIVSSLSFFPESKRKRARKAGQAIRDVLIQFRMELRAITAAALLMQVVTLAIPFALHRWLPALLDPSIGNSRQRGVSLCLLVGLLVVVAVVRSAANYFYLRQAGRVGHGVVAAMRGLAHAHLLRLPVSYIEKRGAGKVLLRFIGDSDAFRIWYSKTGPKLLADLTTLLLVAAALVYLSWQLSLLLTLPLASFAFAVVLFSARIRRQTRYARSRQACMTATVARQFGDIRQCKIANTKDAERKAVDSMFAEVAGLNAQRDQSAAAMEAWAQLSILCAIPLVLLAGFPLVWASRLHVEDFIVFIWLLLHFVVTLRLSLGAVVVHQKALVSVQRLFALLARSAEPGRGAKRAHPSFAGLTIVHEGKSHSFARGIHQLPEEIDIDLLYSELLGFAAPNKLEILLDGVRAPQVDVNKRRSRICRMSKSACVPLESCGDMRKFRIVLVSASSQWLARNLQNELGPRVHRRAIVLCQISRDDQANTLMPNLESLPMTRRHAQA